MKKASKQTVCALGCLLISVPVFAGGTEEVAPAEAPAIAPAPAPVAPAPAAPAPAPEAAAPAGPTFTSNVGFYSNYVFRGISYTNNRPAIQGGFDYTTPSGWYVGTYGTNVSNDDLTDFKQTPPAPNRNVSMEWDLYGGYNGKINDDLTWSAGLLNFGYPGSTHLDTLEANASITWKMLQLKYNHALTDFFSIPGSRGSHYLEANLNYPLPDRYTPAIGKGWTAIAHVGHQWVKGAQNIGFASGQGDYTDYKLGVTKDVGKGTVVGVAWTHTNANSAYYTSANGVNLAKNHIVANVTRTF
jgi:uncharacterized protein (TIGR02001 family)